MNKAILISIRPEHAVNILNGKKTLELRKNVPKDFKGWVYIYVTKAKSYIRELGENYFTECSAVDVNKLNGKVVARFWFDEYTIIEEWYNKYDSVEEILDALQLNKYQVDEYGRNKSLYGWHIKRLEIFDTPMELSEFYRNTNYGLIGSKLKRPPQSWQYVWVKEK